MKQIITITRKRIGAALVPTCSGRDLHRAMGIETRFNDWIRRRIEQYWFEEGQDFEVILKNEYNHVGGPPRTEYSLSLDMAKELAMIERTETGRLVRKYFIRCEHRARAAAAATEELIAARPLWRLILRYKGLGLTNAEIGRLCSRSRDTIRSHVRRMEACGILEPPPDLSRMQLLSGHLRIGRETS